METQTTFSRIIRISDERIAMLLIGAHPKLFFGFVSNKTGCDWLFIDHEELRTSAYSFDDELYGESGE